MNGTIHWPDLFLAARNDERDATWAARAMMELLWSGLAAQETDRRLEAAVAMVQDSGEPAEDLFGSPEEWARAQLDDASEQGADFVADSAGPGTLACVAMGLAAVLSALFGIESLLKGRWSQDFQLGWLLAPPALAITVVAVVTVRERALRRHTNTTAVLLALVTGAVLIAAIVGLFATRIPLGRHGAWWWFVEAAACLGLSVAAAAWLPDASRTTVRASGRAAVDNRQWLQLARTSLRERGGLTEQEIQSHLDEAREHARLGGRSLAEEFGNPIGYSRALPEDPRVPARRRLGLSLLLVVLVGVMWIGEDLHHPSGWLLLYTAFALAGLLGALRRWRAAGEAHDGREVPRVGTGARGR